MAQGAKPVLAVDIDDVLFPLVPLFVEYHNKHHGTDATADQFYSYVFEDDLGITAGEFIERFRDFGATGVFAQSEPTDEVRAAIRKLSNVYDLVIVTSRWQDWEQDTINWLKKHFPSSFRKVHFANSHTWHRGDKLDKGSICKELGATAFIDDSIKNVEVVSRVGIPSYLFGDYAWNQIDELPEGVQRVKDWSEALGVLL